MADLVEARVDPADRGVDQGTGQVVPADQVVPAVRRQDRNRKSLSNNSASNDLARMSEI